MKKIFKKILLWFLSFDAIGEASKKFSVFAWKIKYQRELLERKETEKHIDQLTQKVFRDKLVLHGPFKGLKYPSMRSKSSSLYSKLIGSYELELEKEFQLIINGGYEQIIDIGCAEGYYAVGFALKMPNVKIFAYDIDAEARALTKKMAELNGVEDQVVVDANCSADTLKNFDYTKKTLILSDCEGYERFLFTSDNIKAFKNVDLIIETHDWVNINISTDLENLFMPSHQVEVIQSVSDNYKAKNYHFPEFQQETLETKYRIYEEGRRFVDEWLILKSKN